MVAAVGWGALAACSLVLGALLAPAQHRPPRAVGPEFALAAGRLGA